MSTEKSNTKPTIPEILTAERLEKLRNEHHLKLSAVLSNQHVWANQSPKDMINTFAMLSMMPTPNSSNENEPAWSTHKTLLGQIILFKSLIHQCVRALRPKDEDVQPSNPICQSYVTLMMEFCSDAEDLNKLDARLASSSAEEPRCCMNRLFLMNFGKLLEHHRNLKTESEFQSVFVMPQFFEAAAVRQCAMSYVEHWRWTFTKSLMDLQMDLADMTPQQRESIKMKMLPAIFASMTMEERKEAMAEMDREEMIQKEDQSPPGQAGTDGNNGPTQAEVDAMGPYPTTNDFVPHFTEVPEN